MEDDETRPGVSLESSHEPPAETEGNRGQQLTATHKENVISVRAAAREKESELTRGDCAVKGPPSLPEDTTEKLSTPEKSRENCTKEPFSSTRENVTGKLLSSPENRPENPAEIRSKPPVKGDTETASPFKSGTPPVKSAWSSSSNTAPVTDPASRLKHLWSSFVTCEPNSYSRSCWFENVIHEILRQLDAGISGDNILNSFSTSCHVVSLLGSEFLADVHRVCSVSTEDDFGNLRRYLLQGRGAKCLAVLCALGVQDMSCSKEFTSLLVSLQSAISLDSVTTPSSPHSSSPYATGAAYIPNTEHIAGCLCATLQSVSGGGEVKRKRSNESYTGVQQHQKRKKSSCASKRTRKLSRTSSRSSYVLFTTDLHSKPAHPNVAQVTAAPPPPSTLLNVESTSSENEDSGGTGVPVKSQTLQVTYNALDFEYFTNVIHSGEELEQERGGGGKGRTEEEGERVGGRGGGGGCLSHPSQ
uniref:Uncharacterized protein n=1 Tax=Cacopsylla melanoneura TaxID=428564 RepID=A0A8D8T6Z5_9HEMI